MCMYRNGGCVMNDTNGKVKPFGIKDKLGYMFGDFGNDFTFLLSTMFLLKFYTDVMGVSAALVGLMMMAARFVDAITDVTMGQIVDRSRPGKKGKFAPWIRRMCGPVAVASFQWHLQYQITQQTEHHFLTGEQLVQHLHRQLLVLYYHL